MKDPEKIREKHRRYHTKVRKERPYRAIVLDCSITDRRKGLGKNDLDESFVKEFIKDGCFYCGNNSILITLDRIDNSKSHTRDNVLPCCIRCNLIRRDMPYEAWIKLVPIIKELTVSGMFGDWLSKPIKKK